MRFQLQLAALVDVSMPCTVLPTQHTLDSTKTITFDPISFAGNARQSQLSVESDDILSLFWYVHGNYVKWGV